MDIQEIEEINPVAQQDAVDDWYADGLNQDQRHNLQNHHDRLSEAEEIKDGGQ